MNTEEKKQSDQLMENEDLQKQFDTYYFNGNRIINEKFNRNDETNLFK